MISFMSISMSYASEKIILEDYINSFAWKKRIVLFISKSKYVYFINETDNFFKKNKCENDNRNLKYIRIVGDEVKKYNISEKFKKKYGMWLIGYDGQIKSYSFWAFFSYYDMPKFYFTKKRSLMKLLLHCCS